MSIVMGWDPMDERFKDKNYLFGFKGGERYLSQEFQDIDINKYFKRPERKCYLLPSVGLDICDNDIEFSRMNEPFVSQISTLITTYLLNCDEIELKKNGENGLRPDELINLFQVTINEMNNGVTSCEQQPEQAFNYYCDDYRPVPVEDSPASSRSNSIQIIQDSDEDDVVEEVRPRESEQDIDELTAKLDKFRLESLLEPFKTLSYSSKSSDNVSNNDSLAGNQLKITGQSGDSNDQTNEEDGQNVDEEQLNDKQIDHVESDGEIKNVSDKNQFVMIDITGSDEGDSEEPDQRQNKKKQDISFDVTDTANGAEEEVDDNEVKTNDSNEEKNDSNFEYVEYNDQVFTDLSYESLAQDEQLLDHYILHINKIKVCYW